MKYTSLDTPAVLVDMDAAERNIREMLDGAASAGLAHRPHIKTHKCVELAKLQLSAGAAGITCAKLGEAEIMAEAGINNILVAYPLIGDVKLQRYAELHKKSPGLLTIVNSIAGAKALSDTALRSNDKYDVLIEVDGGTSRGGIAPGDASLEFADSIRDLKGLHICGLMYYPGANYSKHDDEGIAAAADRERMDVTGTAKLLASHGFDMSVLSGGNSVSSKVPQHLLGLTEIRAGNYIFNDCQQLYFDHVSEEQCALKILSTVVCKTGPCTAILDAGTKTLSFDVFHGTDLGYGRICGHPEIKITNLNEEHAFIASPEPLPFEVGDKVLIIPNHACVVPNLAGGMYKIRADEVVGTLTVDARGASR